MNLILNNETIENKELVSYFDINNFIDENIIACFLNSLPTFIYYYIKGSDILILDLLHYKPLKNPTKNTIDHIKNFISLTKKNFDTNALLDSIIYINKDILEPIYDVLQYMGTIDLLLDSLNINLIYIRSEYENEFLTKIKTLEKFTKILNNIDKKKKKYKQECPNILKSNKSPDIDLKETKFETTKSSIIYSCMVDPYLSIYFFFNKIQLNDKILYAYLDDFFKIYTDIIPTGPPPFNTWINKQKTIEDKDKILLMYIQGDSIRSRVIKDDDYLSITIKIQKNKLLIEFALQETTINKYLEEIINELKNINILPLNTHQIQGNTNLDIYDNDCKNYNIEKSIFGGVYNYLDFYKINDTQYETFNKFIFQDLCLNNTIFSKSIIIDESEYSSTEKTSLHFKYLIPNSDSLAVTITPKQITKPDVDKFKLNIGQPYLRIKISKIKNTNSIKIFRKDMSYLLKKYIELKPSIVTFYNKYLPRNKHFSDILNVSLISNPIELNLLTNIEPLMFGPQAWKDKKKYSSFCQQAPIIIDEKEKNEIDRYNESCPQNKQIQIMKYPLKKGDYYHSEEYPYDGPPRFYICIGNTSGGGSKWTFNNLQAYLDSDKKYNGKFFKYPGLRKSFKSN